METGLSLVPSHRKPAAARSNQVHSARRDRDQKFYGISSDRHLRIDGTRPPHARCRPKMPKTLSQLEQMRQPFARSIFSERSEEASSRPGGPNRGFPARQFGSQRVAV